MNMVMSPDKIKSLIEGKGIPAMPGAVAVIEEKMSKPRKTQSMVRCKFCNSQQFNLGIKNHENHCVMNYESKPEATSVCEKCNIGIAIRGLPNHLRGCNGSAERTLSKTIVQQRKKYLVLHGLNNHQTKFKFPNKFVSHLEAELHHRGMDSDWGIDDNMRLVKDKSLISPASPAKMSPSTKTRTPKPLVMKVDNSSVVEALLELLVEEMGAVKLAKNIKEFISWRDLTIKLLGDE